VACYEALVARDTCKEGWCVVVRQGHLKAVVALLIGCAVLLLGVGCAGVRSESPKEQGHTEATKKEQTRSPGATTSEETTVLQREGDRKRPPESTLSYGGREVRSSIFLTYYWEYGTYRYKAVTDSILTTPPGKETLTVPSGSEMLLRYETQRPPNKVSATAYLLIADRNRAPGYPQGWRHPGRSLKAHGSGGERTIPAELKPRPRGYAIVVDVKEPQGRVAYAFRVMVR
jgi:hypothetical protein